MKNFYGLAMVLVVVVASSLLVPFTLPPLVALLFGRSMEPPLLGMMRLLVRVVFIPLAAAELLKKTAPRARFFSPIEPTVAALCTFPFYALVIPVRAWSTYRMRTRRSSKIPRHRPPCTLLVP